MTRPEAAMADIQTPKAHIAELQYLISSGQWDDALAKIATRDAAIRAEERARSANKARDFAAHYSPGTDGRNTFIILAEWIESGARAQAGRSGGENG